MRKLPESHRSSSEHHWRPYPVDDVVGVINDQASAEHAVQALRNAGLPEQDINLLDGLSVIATRRSHEQQHGNLHRFAARLASLFSDDVAYALEYLHEAERGHYLLIVHAPEHRVLERIRRGDSWSRRHTMRQYACLTVTDL